MKVRNAFQEYKQMDRVIRAAVILCIAAFMKLGYTSNAKSNSQIRSSTTPSAYSEYTGYMDECVQWTGYRQFKDQDYDGDGRIDRVFRTYQKNTEYCHYKILFGNQMVIDVSDQVPAIGTPSVRAADMNGDGKNEIVFSLQYDKGHFKHTSVVSTVWDAFVMQDGQDAQLVCSVHLFDKWSNYGLILKLSYADQRFIIKDVILTSDEFAVHPYRYNCYFYQS